MLMASPRARGSTRRDHSRRDHEDGFPARAGIDPGCVRLYSHDVRLPRARGDRPCGTSISHVDIPASPRARGSTHEPLDSVDRQAGFPARAGIDLQQAGFGATRSRASPRARGSTLSGWRTDPSDLGLPRARGDRPGPPPHYPVPRPASPRARGSTHPTQHSADDGGFPARAGIDPARASTRWPGGWLPRARGDRPGALASRRERSVGFPARAGIDLIAPRAARRSPRLPRARGDRPRPTT